MAQNIVGRALPQSVLSRLDYAQIWQRYHWLLYPLLIFVVTRLVVFGVAYISEVALISEPNHWHPQADNVFIDMFARWDSKWYYRIVTEGYLLVEGEQSNVAFFPTYPLAVSITSVFTGNVVLAGIIVSHLCLYAGLVFLYRLTEFEFDDRALARRAVRYIAIFPTSVFFSAVYTESIFFMFAVMTVYFARRQLWTWAALAGVLTSASRIIGVFITAVVLYEWMRAHGWTLATLRRRESWQSLLHGLRSEPLNLLVICLIPAGMISYMVFLYMQFRDPIAFWTTQSAFGRQNLGPILSLLRELNIVLEQNLFAGEINYRIPLDIAAFLLAVIVGLFVWRRLGAGYAAFTLAGAIIPGWSSSGSMTRYVLVLFPIFMMLALWGRNRAVDQALTIGFTVFLGAFTAIFVNWVFLA
jgi:Gpi18-like mannosyltransferase